MYVRNFVANHKGPVQGRVCGFYARKESIYMLSWQCEGQVAKREDHNIHVIYHAGRLSE